jgi:hypothetical protein
MSESALQKLRGKTRERELEKKVEAFRREQIKRERIKHVRLIGAIYGKVLALCAPIEVLNKQRSRELEEELEAALNVFRITTTFIVTPAPQVIVISNSKEQVENLSQLVEKEP